MKHVKPYNENKKNQYPDYFTVGDLKKLLENIDDDLPVGLAGHFGEFHLMDKYDFEVGQAYLMKKRAISWRDADDNYSPIFSIRCPDLGPDPD